MLVPSADAVVGEDDGGGLPERCTACRRCSAWSSAGLKSLHDAAFGAWVVERIVMLGSVPARARGSRG